MISSNFKSPCNLNLETVHYDTQLIIHSFLEKKDINPLKFVSKTQNYNVYKTFYSFFKKRVKHLFSNNLTPEKLLSIATEIFGLKLPKHCHEMEWLNSVIIDNEKELFEKANSFIHSSKVSKNDSFTSFSINEENLHLFNSNQPEFGPHRPNLTIDLFSNEKRFHYLNRSFFNQGITPIKKTYLFATIPKNHCFITGYLDSTNNVGPRLRMENNHDAEAYIDLFTNVSQRLTDLETNYSHKILDFKFILLAFLIALVTTGYCLTLPKKMYY